MSMFLFAESEVMIKSDSLSEDCDLFCSMADSTFASIVKDLFSGAIRICDIDAINKKKPQILKLCSATSHAEATDFSYTLELRVKEYTEFKDYKNGIDSFCRELGHSVLIKG